MESVTTRSRAWLPSNSSRNSLFCKLLLTRVTTPDFDGGGTLLTSGASRLVCSPNRSKHKVPNHFETSLEEHALELAVAAWVRHNHTKYDDHLGDGIERFEAREMVRDQVREVLERWMQREGISDTD